MLVNTGSPLCILGDIVTGFDILLCKDSKIIGGCLCEELLKKDADTVNQIFVAKRQRSATIIFKIEKFSSQGSVKTTYFF